MRPIGVVAASALGCLALAVSAAAATLPITTVVQYDANASEYTEGLAIDHHSNIFSGMFLTTEIRRVAPDGTQSTLAVIDPSSQSVLLGLAVDAAGDVFAAVPSNDPARNGVWRVRPNGEASIYATTDAAGVPNGLAFDQRGNLYASDSLLGVIWKIPRGGGSAILWADSPLLKPDLANGSGFGANGLAFRKRRLYIANTDQALIARVPLKPDGRVGSITVFAADPNLADADGIAFDVTGNLYVARSVDSNALVRVSRTGSRVTTLATAADGLDYPASLAFGTGRGERTSLYLSNVGVNFGRPSVMKADVGIPGVSLP
jgi:sugar lactone lactonase YvrE